MAEQQLTRVNESEEGPVAVITGGGSGVGRAIGVRLAREGYRVVLVGRTEQTLTQTLELAGPLAEKLAIYLCDVADPQAVEAMAPEILGVMGRIDVLVNAAGTNVPQRDLLHLSLSDYKKVMSSNLDGAYYCVRAFLPTMKQQGHGTIVNIVSDAGLRASPKAGPSYVMSKFGMAGLTQSINAELRGDGIRATSIFPGDINTPILDKRPTPPAASARLNMLQPDDVAECAWLAISLPARAIVEELVVRPR